MSVGGGLLYSWRTLSKYSSTVVVNGDFRNAFYKSLLIEPHADVLQLAG